MSTDAGLLVAVGLIGIAVIGGFVVLTALGRPTTEYAVFVAGPLVTSIVAALLSRRVGTVAQAVERVERQTNGVLASQFSDVTSHLARQDVTAAAAAQEAAEDRRNIADERR